MSVPNTQWALPDLEVDEPVEIASKILAMVFLASILVVVFSILLEATTIRDIAITAVSIIVVAGSLVLNFGKPKTRQWLALLWMLIIVCTIFVSIVTKTSELLIVAMICGIVATVFAAPYSSKKSE